MAAFAAAAVAIPSFTGLRVESPKPAAPKPSAFAPAVKASPSMAARASLKDGIPRLGMTVLAASAAGIMMAGNANAIEVLLGGNGGELAFIPKEFQVPAGESIVFKNNAAFPHNVVFDEDEVPAGVDVSAISMNEEDLLNAPGETYSVKLDKKGTYTFYCSPHRGSGMVGKVIVD